MATVFTYWNNSPFFFQHTLFTQGMIEEVILLKQDLNRSDYDNRQGQATEGGWLQQEF